jgi:hypothetical protein
LRQLAHYSGITRPLLGNAASGWSCRMIRMRRHCVLRRERFALKVSWRRAFCVMRIDCHFEDLPGWCGFPFAPSWLGFQIVI